MPPDDTGLNEAIDRFWDQVAQGRSGTAGGLDPVDAATIRHLHAFDNRPDPDRAFTQRLREELMHAHMHAQTMPSSWRPTAHALPRDRSSQRRWPSWNRSGATGWLATAALVLLTLVTGLIAFGWLRPVGENTPAGLPAVLASPTTAATPGLESSLETVFATTLPTGMAPTAGNLDFALLHAVLAPGASGSILSEDVDCCSGPQISFVQEGELTLRVDGPLQLFRGAGAAATSGEVQPGTEVVLHPGDTALYGSDASAAYTNDGTAPVHIIGGALLAGSMTWPPAGFTLLDGNEEYSAPALPPGPVQVTLVRAMLPPTGMVPAPPAGALVLEVGAFGDAAIGQRADGSLRNIGPKTETIYVFTVAPTGAETGTPTP